MCLSEHTVLKVLTMRYLRIRMTYNQKIHIDKKLYEYVYARRLNRVL